MKTAYFLLLSLFVLFTCCDNNKKQYRFVEDKGEIFHTTYCIKYLHNESLKDGIEAKLKEFDNSLNPFKPTSVISKVNNNQEIEVDSFFINVYNKSMDVSQLSNGLFDITLSPLINAWGFGFKNLENVTAKQIDSLRKIIGYKKIHLSGKRIIKDDERININTSAIAKGYSVDVIANFLERNNIHNYMVEIGGEIRAKGANAQGKCWQIAISKPLKDGGLEYQEIQNTVKLCNKSLATSGNFRNYYVKNGKKYAHTIDPRTGYPADNNILSATVIANDCMTADAFATVFMLADTLESKRIAEIKELEFMLILSDESNKFIQVKSIGFDSYIID